MTKTCRELAKATIASLRQIYELGGRHFLVLNVAPLEDSPKYRLKTEIGYEVRHIIGSASRQYNHFLREEIERFEAEVRDVNAMMFDFEKFYRITMALPELFGLTERGRYHILRHGKQSNQGKLGLT